MYGKAVRVPLKEALIQRRKNKFEATDEETRKLRKIDHMLNREVVTSEDFRILLLGTPASGKDEFVRLLECAYRDCAHGQMHYRYAIAVTVSNLIGYIAVTAAHFFSLNGGKWEREVGILSGALA